MTAIIHLLNNLFKLVLLGRLADRSMVLRFGLPAIGASFLGAWLLVEASGIPRSISYDAFGQERTMLAVNLAMAVLITEFAAFEILPRRANRPMIKRHLLIGGLMCGFFGGLSGHQGAYEVRFSFALGSRRRLLSPVGS